MNHFMARLMARLVFCFFAEDTDIFNSRAFFCVAAHLLIAPFGKNL
jgi:hypothetical protein